MPSQSLKLSLLGSEPRPSPQLLPKEVQRVHAPNAPTSQASHERNAPINAEVGVEGCREVNRATSQRRAGKVVASEQRRRVLRIREREVEEDTLDDQEDADGEDSDADYAADPMDRGVCRPCCSIVSFRPKCHMYKFKRPYQR